MAQKSSLFRLAPPKRALRPHLQCHELFGIRWLHGTAIKQAHVIRFAKGQDFGNCVRIMEWTSWTSPADGVLPVPIAHTGS